MLIDIGPSRKQSSTRKPQLMRRIKYWDQRLVFVWKSLLSHSAGFAALTCVCIFIYAFWSATTDKIIVGPFSVPDEYQERGYTSEAISNAVVQFIHGHNSTVTIAQSSESASDSLVDSENMVDHVDGHHAVSSFQPSDIPDIRVPYTSYSLEGLISLLRETVGRPPTYVAGEIVVPKEALGDSADLERTSVLIRYKIEYPEPSKSFLGLHWWSQRHTTIADAHQANGAEDVIRKLALITSDGLARRAVADPDDNSIQQRYLARGNAYFGLHDYERAARMYKLANRNQKKQSSHAYLCLGAIEEQQNMLKEAAESYKQAASFGSEGDDDDASWAIVYWGNLLLHQGAYNEAVEKYQQVIKTKLAADANLQQQLAVAAAEINSGFLELTGRGQRMDKEKARKSFESAAALAGSVYDRAQECLYAQCEAAAGKSSTNESEASLALTLANQLLGRAHYGLAGFHADSSRAVSEYQASVQANPSDARSHYQLAKKYFSAPHTYQQGFAELQKAIQNEPSFAQPYSDWQDEINKWDALPPSKRTYNPRKRTLAADYKSWGDSFARDGNPDEAMVRYHLAAKLDPTYKKLVANLSDPPAIAPTINNGSMPAATASGSRTSGEL